MLEQLEALRATGFDDPEGWYLYGLCLARKDARDEALMLLTRAVDGGYVCHDAITSRPEWDSVRSDARFQDLVERTALMLARARERFDARDGTHVLAPLAPPSSRG
jgi:hypothetical protein